MNSNEFITKMFAKQGQLSRNKKNSLAYSMAQHLVSYDMLSLNAVIRKSIAERNRYEEEKSLKTLLDYEFLSEEKNKHLMFQIAILSADLGKFEQALKYIDMCIGIKDFPLDEKCVLVRAQALLWLGRFEECEKEIVKLEPVQEIQAGVGILLDSLRLQLYHKQQKWELMENKVNKMLQADQNDLLALIYQADGVIINKGERMKESLEYLQGIKKTIVTHRNEFSLQTFKDLVRIVQKYVPMFNKDN